MARPHPALIEIAAGRPPPSRVDDPERLLASAFDHRMQGLLWSAVMKEQIMLPTRTERALAALDLDIQARHQRLWATLEELTTILADEEIEVATFKGVAAEARWYDRTGERPTQDVDLWLSPHQLDRVEEAVQLLQPDHRLAGRLQELTERGHLQSIDVRVGDIWVDLHVDPFKLGIPFRGLEGMWARRVDVKPGITMMDPSASLAQFLLHLNKDRFSWLLGLVDICRIVGNEANPVEEARSIADAEGLSVPLMKSMELVDSVLGPTAESPFPSASGWRSKAWNRLWNRRLLLGGDHGILKAHRRQNLLPFLAEGRVGEALRFNWRTVLPPSDLLDDYYPEIGGPYLVRLVRGRTKRWLERRELVSNLDKTPDSVDVGLSAGDETVGGQFAVDQSEHEAFPAREPIRLKVLYILGSGRSGSTILANVLASDNEVVSTGEMYYIWDRGFQENRRCGCGAWFRDCSFWTEVIRSASLSEREANRALELSDEVARTRNFIRGGHPDDVDEFQEILGRLYHAIARVSGAKVLVDSSKVPVYGNVLARTQALDVFGVLLVRDPRAVAHSWSRRKPEWDTSEPGFKKHGLVSSTAMWVAWTAITERLWNKRCDRFLVLSLGMRTLSSIRRGPPRRLVLFWGTRSDPIRPGSGNTGFHPFIRCRAIRCALSPALFI